MIRKEEYEKLKELYEYEYRWIARDKIGEVYAYESKPIRKYPNWSTPDCNSSWYYLCKDTPLFQYIKWEDEEPTKVLDLIQDYESHQVIVGESEKVTVPQFVAEWIEEVKGLTRNFKLELLFNTVQMPDDVYDWLNERYGDTDILAKAWLDGFVVEKEKLYLVELPNKQRLASVCGVVKFYDEATWFITGINTRLTQSEIESVDPRLMQFAEEVE